MGKRFAIVIGVAALAVAVPALAGQTAKFDSRVTLPPPQKHPFHGVVRSIKHACEVHRKVKVFWQRPGPDRLLGGGTDWSNRSGNWSARQLVLAEGDYYAKVMRSKKNAAGTSFVCRGDRSPTRHVLHQG
ncbi:MAG TPA: hypothetical protein VGP93_12135, partial [Polyangiaceae bacterium]|jgi:hypothetical protein|nr:hypothetical protein [Polyangiaceae bacterium]